MRILIKNRYVKNHDDNDEARCEVRHVEVASLLSIIISRIKTHTCVTILLVRVLLRWKRRNESSTPSWVWEYAWWEECHTVCKWLKFMGENFLYSKPTCYFLTSFSAFYTFNQATFKVFSWLHKILNFKITLRIFQSLLNYFF